ncbi:MAG: CoA transferase [Chloroflexi bacterium]|nr:CoA transferase [Chloroflexota bacterium]
MAGPLNGIQVVDLTRALAGPYCTLVLGDLGADVIKIEQPGSGDETRGWGPPFVADQSAYFMSINRNKRSLTLDLKAPEGQEILGRLIDRADVLVENFRPGAMARLGFSYDHAQQRNPKLIYCAVSGFGQTGPRANQPAYDQIVQGLSGAMSLTGPVEGPPSKFGIAISDIGAGMWAAMAVNAALFHRERTGQGQFIDTSMIGGLVALLTFQAGRYFATGNAPGLGGNRHPTIAPYETFKTSDGWLNVACGNEGHWQRFCRALGLDDLLADERFASNALRVQHRPALSERLEPHIASMTTGQAVSALEAAEVPAGPVFNLAQVFADPQAKHLQLQRSMEHLTAGLVHSTGFPWEFGQSPAEIRLPPPVLGQHTDEVLAALDYTPARIADLRSRGVV